MAQNSLAIHVSRAMLSQLELIHLNAAARIFARLARAYKRLLCAVANLLLFDPGSGGWRPPSLPTLAERLATQLKLDELIRAVEQASNRVINIEEGSQEQLEALHTRFRREAEQAAAAGDADAADAKQGIADVAAAVAPLAARRR